MAENGRESLGPCPICGREMVAGPSVDRHHWIPKLKGGRETDWVHRVCHKKIHALFSEAELARVYNSAEALRAHPEIARFVRWLAKKPPDFNTRHDPPRKR